MLKWLKYQWNYLYLRFRVGFYSQDAKTLARGRVYGTVREVSLDWLSKSDDVLAKQFREVASRTPTNECVLCAMFFEDKGYSFSEIDEDELDHFQQIADYARLPIKIVSLI